MKEIIFRTSKRTKIKILLFWGTLLLLLCWASSIQFFPIFGGILMGVIVYFNSIEKYILTDYAITIKRGGLLGKSEIIQWTSIADVSTVNKGFRLNYVGSNGEKHCCIIINLENIEKMRDMIEEYVSRNTKEYSKS